ncbi:SIR2 family protein [Metapseudomonas otitidis]|uniref:SIR2 family protein n=1 Tax=Metapseudomonas otitidis TaxID=319939 RepID=UPI001AAF8D2B|nr:SIR2 family protein [Pseudomonas otitidis]MBO2927072.1 SIR2 family protein [Pseudomonas otitidis]
MQIQNEALFKHHLTNGINIFTGSGFSTLAEGLLNGIPKSMPTGDGLRKELLEFFNRDPNSNLSLSQLCQILSATKKDELVKFLRTRFSTANYNKEYEALNRVNIKSIFTTNIDDLAYRIYEDSEKYYLNDIALRGPSINERNAIDYIALHGCVRYEGEGFDFSPIEIASSFERDKDKWFGYIDRIKKTPTLYWGYSVSDAGVLQSLAKDTTNERDRAPSWIVLRREDKEAIEYYGSLGFQIIIGETLQLLNYFKQLKTTNKPNKKKLRAASSFKEYTVPEKSQMPVRTLGEFYLGAEPIWYDVFYGNLHKNEHFHRIRNGIADNKSIILTGGALTGKTTLLKLLTITSSDFGWPFYIEEITPEKANLFKREIDSEGRKALLFIDNAGDAWEAINLLIDSPNIKVIAAERDYIYDSVAHRFPRKKFEAIDVTGLTELDVQAVRNKIPSGLKRRATIKPIFRDLEIITQPTFFEVIDSAIEDHSLADRYIEALKNLKIESPLKHGLLILCCYMYSCRVPTSVDVAIAYARSHATDANYILETLNSMGSFLSAYEGALADENQAYFVPRSRSVAEAVMRRIPTEDLKQLLLTFHTEVSPTKISRYDIFRRGAYEAGLVGKAFPNWTEGLKFYELASSRDHTHSLKQQGAIYLAHKKQYHLAFNWIDEALTMIGRRNAPVKNTYAVILFSANSDKPLDSDVVASLNESMEILANCYSSDIRKAYHAKVFADQAVKFANRLPNQPESIQYLDQAIEWLEAELKLRIGDRTMTRMIQQLKQSKRSLNRATQS